MMIDIYFGLLDNFLCVALLKYELADVEVASLDGGKEWSVAVSVWARQERRGGRTK